MTDFNKLSLRRRIDRNAAFQDWRLQRFPAAKEMTSLSRKVTTPHFDQASRLAGGTLNLFCIGTFWGQRDQIELEQRFDVKCDGIFTNGNAGLPPRYWLNEIYAHQIFSGKRNPSRDKLICLCFGLGLDVEEMQLLLRACGYSNLYVKRRRESVILYARLKGLTLLQCNELLYDEEEPLLQ